VLRRLGEDAGRAKDEAATWKQAEKLLNEGALKLRSMVRLDGSKQSVVFERGTMRMSPSNLADLPAGKEGEYATSLIGTRFESKPRLRDAPPTLDFDATFEHHFAPQGQSVVHVGELATEERFPLGVTKLIGIWKMEGAGGNDIMQAAFLRADVITVGRD
jgi:hypothetical protein